MIAPKFDSLDVVHDHLLTNEKALAHLLGGKATFTARSLRTEAHFTFKVQNTWLTDRNRNYILTTDGKRQRNPNFKWVFVMTGPDNDRSYTYIGSIFKTKDSWEYKFSAGKQKYKETAYNGFVPIPLMTEDFVQVKTFKYIFSNLLINKEMPQVEYWSSAHCCCCGKKLTNASSIENRMGPVCAPRFGKILEELEAKLEKRKQIAYQKLAQLQQAAQKPVQKQLQFA